MVVDKRDILINLIGKETISPAADKAGRGLGQLGDRMDATADDARRLDQEIDQAEQGLRDLAVAFSRTQDVVERVDLTRKMRQQQTEIRRLSKAKDLLPDMSKAGEEAAQGFGVSFIQRLGPLVAQAPLGPAGASAGAVAAAAMAPVIASSISGAVLGGVGIGGVIGGLALAAQDSRVRSAGSALAATVSADLDEIGAGFVGPAIHGIGIIRSAWDDVSDDVRAVGQATSRYVEPLAQGVADAVREIMPGVRAAAEAAGPVMREIGDGIARIGGAIGDVLTDMSGNADEGAAGIRAIAIAGEWAIRVGGAVITTLADILGWVVKVGQATSWWQDTMLGWIPGLGTLTDSWVSFWGEMDEALKGGGEAGEEAGSNIYDGLMKAGEGADSATTKVETLNEALERLTNQNISAEKASIALEEAVDRAAEAAGRNGKTTDINTEAGRKNRQALIAIAEAANRAAEATLAQTGSQEAAKAASDRGRESFIRTAQAMGMTRAEAERLADQLFAIPNIKRTVSVETARAQASIRAVQQSLGKIKDVRVGVYFTRKGDLRLPGGTQLKGASTGGPVTGSGPKGVDSEPYLLARGEHIIPASEVDAAGGHAGIERIRAALRGGQRPSGIGVAASYQPAPSSVQPSRTVIEIRSGGSRLDDLLVEILRRAIRERGGNVQVVLGRS